jgi:hypothetical protein
MAKSIHERVRATLEKQARDAKRAERVRDERSDRREEKRASDYERGFQDGEREGSFGFVENKNLSREYLRGVREGIAASDREILGTDYL